MTHCIICGQRPPEPANLLAVCQPCIDLLEGQDAERMDVDPHTRFRDRYPLVRRTA